MLAASSADGARRQLRRRRRRAGGRRDQAAHAAHRRCDQYGGSMPSGWTRFVLEQFEFPFEVVYPKALDAGNLTSQYDVLIFPSGRRARRRRGGAADVAARRRWWRWRGERTFRPSSAIARQRHGGADRAAAQEVPRGRRHDHRGRPLGDEPRRSCSDLPIENHLRRAHAGRHRRGRCRARSTTSRARSCGSRSTTRRRSPRASTNHVDVFFDNSPVFRLEPDAAVKGVRPVAWFDSATPLRSGWAWGQNYLEGGVAVVEAHGRQGQAVPVRAGDHVPRRSRTGRSSSCSTALTLRLDRRHQV